MSTSLSLDEEEDKDRVITLDVRGVIFKVLISTLKRKESFFYKLIGKNFEQNNTIFINRDSKHFNCILNYLEDGFTPIPVNHTEATQLYMEAKFYGLLELTNIIEIQFPICECGKNFIDAQFSICTSTNQYHKNIDFECLKGEKGNDGQDGQDGYDYDNKSYTHCY